MASSFRDSNAKNKHCEDAKGNTQELTVKIPLKTKAPQSIILPAFLSRTNPSPGACMPCIACIPDHNMNSRITIECRASAQKLIWDTGLKKTFGLGLKMWT